MSIDAMNAVFAMELKPPEKLVALALADHADADGGNIWPAVERIAWKTGYSLRHVRRLIGELCRRKVLIEAGKGPAGTVKYQLALGAAGRPAYVPGVTNETETADAGVTNDAFVREGVTSETVARTPESGARTPESPKPSLTINKSPEQPSNVIPMTTAMLREAGVRGRPLAELATLPAGVVMEIVNQGNELERQGTVTSKAGWIVGALRKKKAAASEPSEDYSGFVAQPAAVEPVRDIPAGPLTAWGLVMEQARLQLHPDGFNALWKDLEMLEDRDGVMLVRINKTGAAAAYCLDVMTHPSSGHCRMLGRLLRDCAGGRSVAFCTLDDYQRAAGD